VRPTSRTSKKEVNKDPITADQAGELIAEKPKRTRKAKTQPDSNEVKKPVKKSTATKKETTNVPVSATESKETIQPMPVKRVKVDLAKFEAGTNISLIIF